MAMEATKAKSKPSKKETVKTDKFAKKNRFLGDPRKQKITAIAVLVIGLVMLVVGIVFLVLRSSHGTVIKDGEYLISAENWQLDNEEGVIWDFTEIGKGTLTTNNHQNDYSFEWMIKDDKLSIRTDWLQEINNEYEYELDQTEGILILKEEGQEYRFLAK